MTREQSGMFSPASNEFWLVSAIMVLLVLFSIISIPYGNEPPEWFSWGPVDEAGGGDGGNDDTPPETYEQELRTESGWTGEGATAGFLFEIDDTSVVGFIIELTWTDDIGDNDEMGLVITNETTEFGSSSGTSGPIIVKHEKAPDESLIGEFEVGVEAVDCPGMVSPLPVDRDTGNDWTVKVTLIIEEAG